MDNREHSFYILHLADIHIRDTEPERDKFRKALEGLATFIQNLLSQRRRLIVVIAGDIFHYKTRLSAENLTDCYALLDCLAQHASDLVIIPGNHDANLNNETRIDLLTPIMKNCRVLPGKCTLHYCPRSGWETLRDCPIQFYIFSPLSVPAPPTANSVSDASMTRIAIVHDFIDGLRIQGSSGHGPIKKEWLESFHCVMCGHSHDYQVFVQPNKSLIVYSGALTQLTIGESFDKGFVLWDFVPGQTITQQFVYLPTPRSALVKYVVTAVPHTGSPDTYSLRTACNISMSNPSRAIPRDCARVVVEMRAHVSPRSPEVMALCDGIRKATDTPVEFSIAAENIAREVSQKITPVSTLQVQNELIEAKLRASNPNIDAATIQAVLKLHTDTINQIIAHDGTRESAPCGAKWSLVFLEWSDLFCYGSHNYINFSNISGLAGLIAPNRCGKSSILDILVLALFNEGMRGKIGTIIRRGCREGSLRCIWMSYPQGTRHEITRKWDIKGHAVMRYFVDGQNCTGSDLKTTYRAIEKIVGTADDFLSAVLIPQHADLSFLDATDGQKRAILARILGLDLLDDALELIKDQERGYQSDIKSNAAMVESAIARIEAFKPEGARDSLATLTKTARNLLEENTKVAEAEYQAQIARSDEYVKNLKKQLEALEAQPSVSQPTRSVEDINREIHATAAKVARLEGEIAEIEARIKISHANLAILREENPQTKNCSVDAIDVERARLTQLTAKIDQHMLLLGRAKGTQLSEVPAQLAAATKKLGILLEMRTSLTELMAIDKLYEADKRCITAFPAQEAEYNATYPSQDVSQRDTITSKEVIVDVSLPRECKCKQPVIHDTAQLQQARKNLLDALLRKTFAAEVALPDSIPANILDCIEKSRKALETLASNAVAESPKKEWDTEAMFMLARSAIQMVRLSSAISASQESVAEQLETARYCVTFHERIVANNALIAKRDFLKLREEYLEAKSRAEKRGKLRASLTAAAKEIQITKPVAPAVAGTGSAPLVIPIPSLKNIKDHIFECERAICLLSELQTKTPQIRAALALDAEISTLRSRIDTCFSIQRLTLVIDNDKRLIETIRARITEANASIEGLKAQIEPNIAQQKEYAAFVARQGEIRAQRNAYGRAQTAYMSLVAEFNEFSRMREDLSATNKRIAIAHQAHHICQLYKMTLDTKTGIQYNLMSNAIAFIEAEANRIFEPIAQLKLKIDLGRVNTAVSSTSCDAMLANQDDATAPSTSSMTSAENETVLLPLSMMIPNLARANKTRTTTIFVRDTVSGIEHPAELCSGFQRFILSIALRRAFLRSSIRPMPQFMIIDEGFGCLDESNMAKVCGYLPELARELNFMLIVSHIDSLNTMLTTPLVIEVGQHGDTLSSLRFGEDIEAFVPTATAITPAPAAASATATTTATTAATGAASGINAVAIERAPRKKKVRASQIAVIDPAIVDKRADGTMFCKVCGMDFANWIRHAKTKKHVARTAKHLAEQLSTSLKDPPSATKEPKK